MAQKENELLFLSWSSVFANMSGDGAIAKESNAIIS